MKKLRDLSQKGSIKMVTTPIVLKELEAQFAELAENAAVFHGKITGKCRGLALGVSKGQEAVFNTIDWLVVGKKAAEFFTNYLKNDLGATIVPITGAVDRVFDRYFALKPPFTSKKKAEFPDCFSIVSVQEWVQRQGGQFCVFSHDKGVLSFCEDEGHDFFDDLAKLLEHASGFEEEVLEQLKDLLMSRIQKVIHEATKQFEDGYPAIIVACVGGHAEDISATDVDIGDLSVIEIDGNQAVVNVGATVSFEANVSYADPEGSYYDKEDKEFVALRYVSETVEDSVDVDLEVGVEFNLKHGKLAVRSVEIVGPTTYVIDPTDDGSYR